MGKAPQTKAERAGAQSQSGWVPLLNSIPARIRLFALALLIVDFGFLAAGRSDTDPANRNLLYTSAVIVAVLVILSVSTLLYFKPELGAPGLAEGESKDVLRDGFAHTLGVEVFEFVDNPASNLPKRNDQIEAYVTLLVGLEKAKPGEDEGTKGFRKQMADTARSRASDLLSMEILGQIKSGVEARRAKGEILGKGG